MINTGIMPCLFQAKQLCEVLEQQLVDLLVLALERFEHDSTGHADSQLHWQHLSSQLIYFVLFQFASFSHIVLSLYEKVFVLTVFVYVLLPLVDIAVTGPVG